MPYRSPHAPARLSGGALPCSPVLLALLLLVAAPMLLVSGQNVTRCEPLSSDVGCTQFGLDVGDQIFVPAGQDLATLEFTVTSYVAGVNFIVTKEPCRSLLVRMLCSTYLRQCINTTSGAYPLPVPLCRYQCEFFSAECAEVYQLVGQPLGAGLFFPPGANLPLTCLETDFFAQDQEMYPVSDVQYDVSGALTTEPCNNLTGVPLIVPIACKDPLQFDPDKGGCAFTCPLPALTDDEYENAKVMQGVIGWFSWAGTVFLFFNYILIPALRKFPRNMILMTALAAHIAAGAIILPTYAGYDNIWCGGDTQFYHPSYNIPPPTNSNSTEAQDYIISFDYDELLAKSSPCSFQGALLQFGYLAATFWWGLIAFNIFLEVYFNALLKLDKAWPKWIRIVLYHLIGWGIPFIFMVIPAGAGRIGLASGGTYCFITPEDNQAYQLTFWFLPVGITLLLGFTFFVLAIIRIVIMMIMLRKLVQLWRYVRLLIFIFLYLFLFCFIFSYNIQLEVDQDAISEGYSLYFRCLTQEDNCKLDSDVSNYDLIMLKGFAISVLGFLLFLLFISWEILYFWYLVGKALVRLAMNMNSSHAMVVVRLFTSSRSASSSLQPTDDDLSTAAGDSKKSKSATEVDSIEPELEEEEGKEETASSSESSDGAWEMDKVKGR